MSEKPELVRSSSFARSFFQAGGEPMVGNGSDEGGGAPPEAAASVALSGGGAGGRGGGAMRRRQSRRRLSRGASGRGGDMLVEAAAAAQQFEDDEPTSNLPHIQNTQELMQPESATRQSSWYTDALLQGGSEDLNAILNTSHVDAMPNHSTPDDDEVLEQYRIMAHLEANRLVKENTGFDLAEYERRRKTNPEPVKSDYYSGNKKIKPKLPEPRMSSAFAGISATGVKAEEPPLPAPQPNSQFVRPRASRMPELSPGVVVRGQGHIPDGDHVVRCLGCKASLRVNILATLVNCPDCHTVSPASSTRR